MDLITRPMLAVAIEDLSKLNYSNGLYATPKLDGIRCLIVNYTAVSRTFKPIPNKKINKLLSELSLNNFDGEIIIEDSNGIPLPFNEISSVVMSFDKDIPENCKLKYYIFDYVKEGPNKPYLERLEDLKDCLLDRELITPFNPPSYRDVLKPLYPTKVSNIEELETLYTKTLTEGFEGLILRTGTSPYKFGKSTFKEHYLMKLKPFEDAEAVIVDLVEAMENGNAKELDNFGNSKRSSHMGNLIAKNTLGAFKVTDVVHGYTFNIGTGIGLTKELKQEIWNNKDKYIGKMIKYRSQKIGEKDLPRIPSFIGFRSSEDL